MGGVPRQRLCVSSLSFWLLLQDSSSSDPLGDKWGDAELKTFYRLYRDHGTNWGKVRQPPSLVCDSANLLLVAQNGFCYESTAHGVLAA